MSGCPNRQPGRHPEYFLPRADLYIVVDNVLFRVHSYFFERDSAKFKTLLETPVAPNTARSGSSETKPIVIQNSSPSDFAKFLFIIYNPTYSDYSSYAVSDWTSVLKTACEHDFVEVQHCAIRGLQSCDLTTVERIHIYRLYKADARYLVPLYIDMARRDEGPNDREVDHLGSEASLLIYRLREHLRSRTGLGGRNPLPADVTDEDALQAVCHFLQLDMSQFQSSGAGASQRISRVRRSPRRVPTPRGQSLDRETLEERRRAHNFDQFLEGCKPVVPVSQKNNVVEGQIRSIPGQFEDWKEAAVSNASEDNTHLPLVLYRENNITGLYEKDSVEDVSIVFNFGRGRLMVCAISWTFVFFWALSNIPHIHLL